jgi:Ca2+-binding EF-hand superfamily protein
MSGNKNDGHTIENRDCEGGSLKLMMDLLWIKLEERFSTMGQAFRFFDKNYNNRVSFGEFQKALDTMRIKFQVD